MENGKWTIDSAVQNLKQRGQWTINNEKWTLCYILFSFLTYCVEASLGEDFTTAHDN